MGNVLQAGGQVVQGVATFGASRARAKAMQAQAKETRKLGDVEYRRRTEEGRRQLASATARAAASGFTVEGSALNVIADLARENDANARGARWAASREALSLRNTARQVKAQGNAALLSGVLQAGGSLIQSSSVGNGGDPNKAQESAGETAKQAYTSGAGG